MPSCTFFGHRDCSQKIAPTLRAVLVDLIERNGVDVFFVGNHGRFDQLVLHQLIELSKAYPHIQYSIVLAYMPSKAYKSDLIASHSILPEGIETVHPQYAIPFRNRWMVEHADYAVTYVIRGFGGAAKFAQLAKKKGKRVIELA